VLARIPRAVLAFSPANPAARSLYLQIVGAAGIAAERIVFIPQGRTDAENQARYELVDFVLDPMPFGGVNGTLEALDMGVPVVTLVGRRHGERTGFSILTNLGVTDVVANSGPGYVEIAVRLATDPHFMARVRAAIRDGIAASTLTDMPRTCACARGRLRGGVADQVPGGVSIPRPRGSRARTCAHSGRDRTTARWLPRVAAAADPPPAVEDRRAAREGS
jgi:hypothetical protein